MAKKKLYCLKVVKKIVVSEENPEDYDLVSILRSRISCKYKLGKKTTPKFGPLFCIPITSNERTKMSCNDWLLFHKVERALLLCEYEPYPDYVSDIPNPLIYDGFQNDILIEFWKTVSEKTDILSNMAIPRSFETCAMTRHQEEGKVLFAKYVKPIRMVDISEIPDIVSSYGG